MSTGQSKATDIMNRVSTAFRMTWEWVQKNWGMAILLSIPFLVALIVLGPFWLLLLALMGGGSAPKKNSF